ncbi:hypothetical protein DAPPUDRAFT_329105 [Daphnia pulex]|uniref:Uncharacterized protein n=1 Tax=Daphnia pulex TaxID=6669 RepID=E9HFP4_DAPPU|nr:hypothetical protein DAPPUDRAFT_270591 [Daphnia pulex]EFX69462.1 hypothetical protein DAPPUDRAFT_329105 [Daphnia pulex]|eukprot:EFX62336.1 hypothetical protein DAPPUDRAFT_270591 [Daphnia pulex]
MTGMGGKLLQYLKSKTDVKTSTSSTSRTAFNILTPSPPPSVSLSTTSSSDFAPPSTISSVLSFFIFHFFRFCTAFNFISYFFSFLIPVYSDEIFHKPLTLVQKLATIPSRSWINWRVG